MRLEIWLQSIIRSTSISEHFLDIQLALDLNYLKLIEFYRQEQQKKFR